LEIIDVGCNLKQFETVSGLDPTHTDPSILRQIYSTGLMNSIIHVTGGYWGKWQKCWEVWPTAHITWVLLASSLQCMLSASSWQNQYRYQYCQYFLSRSIGIIIGVIFCQYH